VYMFEEEMKEDYKEQTVGKLQQKMLYVKYERTLMKMNGCKENGNIHMYEIYKREIDKIRMTLGILGIHIKGINI
jgi:hypothetical protein